MMDKPVKRKKFEIPGEFWDHLVIAGQGDSGDGQEAVQTS